MLQNRILSIDISKAICIVLVVIGHYKPDISPVWYIKLNSLIYSFHMPLFMFASGYIYFATLKGIKYKEFIGNKFKRLIIPYFSLSIIIIIIKLISSHSLTLDHPVSISTFYEMLYSPVAAYFLWFIYTLFIIFLFIPFFYTSTLRIILLILSFILLISPFSFPEFFCLQQVKNFLIYFVLGIIAFEWKNSRKYFTRISFVYSFCMFIFFYFLKDYLLISGLINKILSFCIALLGILFVSNLSIFIAKKNFKINSILLSIATYTFPIYLLHTTFEGFTKAILLKTHLSTWTNEFISFLLSAIIVISSGVILPMLFEYLVITRSKILCLLFGVKYVIKK